MAKFKVEISGMSCNHCVGHVKSGLEGNSKVRGLDVSIGSAVVEGDLTAEEVREIIEDEGYDVISIVEA